MNNSYDNLFITYQKNDIYLNDKQIQILKKYNIAYQNYSNLTNLLFDIEMYLTNQYANNYDDLEWVSESLAEFNYYHNTNK